MTGGAAALAREVEGEGVRLIVGRPKWGRVTRGRGWRRPKQKEKES
jgi:hypothetical protein